MTAMRALSAGELLAAWERGLAQAPAQRALTLLGAACPDTPVEALATLCIGQRDAYLITLREWCFGSQLVSVANCAGCGERLELTLDLDQVRVQSPTPAGPLAAEGQEAGEAFSLSVDGYEVHFRLPNSLDLAAVDGQRNVESSRQRLLERCILDAKCEGKDTPADQLPAPVTEAVVAGMAQADPQADVQLDLRCPACEHRWQAAFDIASFFWSEINAWAYRTLHEVHLLASAYGWREADILALSPRRRQSYLEMIGRP